MNIYLAASWKNEYHGFALAELRDAGHKVYDFKNPSYSTGFKWEDIGLTLPVKALDYRIALYSHPRAAQGFLADFNAMRWADACVMVLPSGRSAHLELGYMAGAGKKTFILTRDGEEPELMALMATKICIDMNEILEELK